MLFEISYSVTNSFFLSNNTSFRDRRVLSVAFKEIVISKKIIISFSSNKTNVNHLIVFGFHEQESWGSWSRGSKSCFLCIEKISNDYSIDFIIDAHPFVEAFSSCRISIKSCYGHRGSVYITGKGPVRIRLRRTIFPRNQRLVVGDFTKIVTGNIFSLQSDLPKVSIILLNFEKYHLTRLAAIAAASSGIEVPFEILCVDNGSSKECLAELKEGEVPLKILELRDNLGFGPANNLAANEARGEYLLFLNNDAFLDKGAVDEMLLAFQKMHDCRIAGSVLRFPDGLMQEAGATLQSDGYPIRHGRSATKFKPRKLPPFQPVDYVSGACLMIRKSDFLEMGGFDEKYSPAYYEDTDLCMRSLLYGQKVYLASRANCYHIENATTSTIEQGAWATRTAEAHREIFLKDWGAYLASRDPKDLPWHLRET